MLELLAPAGSMEAVAAAVQNGADAVYLGYGDFNARRNAKNFSEEEFAAAVSYCHLRGAKVYLTLNTLVTDRELPAAARTAAEAAEAIGIGLPGNGTIPAVYSKRLQLGRRAGAAWARGRAGGAPGVIRLVYLMCPLLRLPRPRLSPGAYPTTEF